MKQNLLKSSMTTLVCITIDSCLKSAITLKSTNSMSNGSIDIFNKTDKLGYSFTTGVYPVKIKLLNWL
jgi:hypothetical protein